ncbi:MAG TPA: SPFH domain-containing protein [Candidatus Woesearchaeota archaeon]|nr:SPFH domain-containing protein [Candidatus Woesearchaeota archaeon]
MISEILIFVGIAAFIFGFMYSSVVRTISYLGIAVVVIGVFFKFFIKKYDEVERAVIFRFGKFHRIAGPGWAFVVPLFEKEYAKLDVRTKTTELFVPVAFTHDDLRLKVDGTVYYQIKDPSKAVLKIDNYMTGLTNMMISETRNLIASMKMREVFAGLDSINNVLADKIRHATWRWGIDIPMVQLRSIMPPEEIAVAMQKPELAEKSLQAQRFNAEAKKVVLEALGEGAKNLNDKAVMYLYLKALEEMSKGQATKIVFPMQFMSAMNEIGKGFGLGTGMGASGINVDEAVNAIKTTISAPV